VAGGRGLLGQDIQHFVDFREPGALDRVAEENLVAIVVARRVELEQSVAHQLRS
jgi:hypothetical protein